MRIVWIGWSIVCMLSCLDKSPTRFDHTTVEPSESSNEVITNPVKNRHIWQQPDVILNRLGDLEGKTIADLGAGTGYFAFRFLKRGAKVKALDIDPKMIDLINQEATYLPNEISVNLQTRLVPSDDPGLEDEEVDIVFVANTYMYIQNRVQYFRDMTRAFKAGGQLVIVDFKKKNTAIGPPLEQRLSLGTVESELSEAGYRIVMSDDISLEFQYIVIAEVR